MFKPFQQQSGEVVHSLRIKQWTSERFALPESATVMVAEIECQVPGCPPIETVIAFWGANDVRYRFKVFKPLNLVVQDDVPPGWLLPSLEDYDDLGCDCC